MLALHCTTHQWQQHAFSLAPRLPCTACSPGRAGAAAGLCGHRFAFLLPLTSYARCGMIPTARQPHHTFNPDALQAHRGASQGSGLGSRLESSPPDVFPCLKKRHFDASLHYITLQETVGSMPSRNGMLEHPIALCCYQLADQRRHHRSISAQTACPRPGRKLENKRLHRSFLGQTIFRSIFRVSAARPADDTARHGHGSAVALESGRGASTGSRKCKITRWMRGR